MHLQIREEAKMKARFKRCRVRPVYPMLILFGLNAVDELDRTASRSWPRDPR